MDIAQTASFNSMKVRLKHGVLDAHHVPIVSFNSMKVRLKRNALYGFGGAFLKVSIP